MCLTGQRNQRIGQGERSDEGEFNNYFDVTCNTYLLDCQFSKALHVTCREVQGVPLRLGSEVPLEKCGEGLKVPLEGTLFSFINVQKITCALQRVQGELRTWIFALRAFFLT